MATQLIDEPRLTPAEKWERARITNSFLFYKIMTSNPEECRQLIEILLEKPIERIEFLTGEHTIDIDWDAKGIRLDVYVKGTDEVYDLEMQASDTGDLPKRARYYQGLIDVDNLKSGMMYSALKPQYVIFICLTDVFGRGLPIYHFENVCTDLLSAHEKPCFFNDGAYKIFFNCSDYDKIKDESEQKKVLQFFKDGTETSAFSRRLKQLESSAKTNAQWRQQYMTWEMEMNIQYHKGIEQGIEQGREQGIKQGIEQGRSEEKRATALKMIELNLPAEQISQITGLSKEEILELKAMCPSA